MHKRFFQFAALAKLIGWKAAWDYYRNVSMKNPTDDSYSIHPKASLCPLRIRHRSSDLAIFRQIFVAKEYDCLKALSEPSFIVDCGANVGYTSAYVLSLFTNAILVAIEPEPNNFTALKDNLKHFGVRVRALNAGVWSHSTGLVLSEEKYRDGSDCTRQVRAVFPGERSQFQGIGISELLSQSTFDRISLLKMDIEGAEAVVFSGGSLDWLDRVDSIAIELHSDSSFGDGAATYHKAIAGRGFKTKQFGEITFSTKY